MKRIYGKLKGKGLSRLFPTNFFAKLAVRNMEGDYTANVQGFKMTVPIRQAHGMVLYLKGIYEPAVTKFVKFFLREGMNFVDVGACLGYYSLLASHIVKTRGIVLAFEPETENLAYLYENISFSSYNNIVVNEKAASDKVGKMVLNVSKHIGCHSLLYSKLSGHDDFTIQPQNVETVPVDRCIDRIDMIKIDVEGWEYFVLKGIESFLSLNDYSITVIMEHCPSLLQENPEIGAKLMEFLDSFAHKIYVIDPKKNKLQPHSVEEIGALNERVNLIWMS